MPRVSTDVPEYREPEKLNGRYAFRCETSKGQMERDDPSQLRNLILNFSCIDGPPTADGESAMGRKVTLFVPFYEKPEWDPGYKERVKTLKQKLFAFANVDSSDWDTDTSFVDFEVWAVCRPGQDVNGVVVDQIRDLIEPYSG